MLQTRLDLKIAYKHISSGRFLFDLCQLGTCLPIRFISQKLNFNFEFQRKYSLTESLVKIFDKEFDKKLLSNLQNSPIELIINGIELRTFSAIRFGAKKAVCWRFGEIDPSLISLGEAVAVSAAYPLLLPALERKYSFSKKGITYKETVSLSDGGTYDNLGLTPFISTNDFADSYPRPELDYIIACDAAHGQLHPQTLPHTPISRLHAAFKSLMSRSRHSNFKTLHKLKEDGDIKGFSLAYLGQQDERIPIPPIDLVQKNRVDSYPTDFKKMSDDNFEVLTKRGRQLTESLTTHYLPELF